MTYTYCATSHCPLAEMCARFEDAAGRRLMQRTYADFGEELMRNADGTVACPFFIDKATSHVD